MSSEYPDISRRSVGVRSLPPIWFLCIAVPVAVLAEIIYRVKP